MNSERRDTMSQPTPPPCPDCNGPRTLTNLSPVEYRCDACGKLDSRWNLSAAERVQTHPLPKDRSVGSIGIAGLFEFIVAPNGDLYKAPTYNPLDVHGYRQGARFEATAANDHSDQFARYLRNQGFEVLIP
jgi:hypothetical protein